MGHENVAKILADNYPKYMSYLEIMKKMDISRRTVLRSLSKLKERNEIQFKQVLKKAPNFRWVTLYRAKP